ncbi:MAG: hypothetical protein M1833_007128 [Piccolia ochrophora]|nr:MAG: hypothetical protein M1833_007128 [Piccolia ochrophora]
MSVPQRVLITILTLLLFSTYVHILQRLHYPQPEQAAAPAFTQPASNASSSSTPHVEPKKPYSHILVVARTKAEDVSWIEQEFPSIDTAIYTVDDETATLRPPQNKGHESMVYLSHIIGNYNDLPDTSIFIHAHKYSWHNNDLLYQDTASMLRRLNHERVAREGYMSLRCHSVPGCPNWISLSETTFDPVKVEQWYLPQVWNELHPGVPMPDTLAAPCCSQFAVTRARIQSVPLSEWVRYRDWLLNTNLTDDVSGRIWEYNWHFILTGETSFCPPTNECYCDGYGVCFGSARKTDEWFELREARKNIETKLEEARESNRSTAELRRRAVALDVYLAQTLNEALERGMDPRERALEVGREWKEEDGF